MAEVHKILVAIGATYSEKEEWASYRLQDFEHTWCMMLKDSRVLGGDSVNWEIFQTTFMDIFFPGDMREAML